MKTTMQKIKTKLQAFGQCLWAATKNAKCRVHGKFKDCLQKMKVFARR